jgi:hypothetical protein
MLKSYFELLKSRVEITGMRLKYIEDILERSPTPKDFIRSEVNIIAWTYGNENNEENLGRLVKPQTLEDIFQIIHQSLLVVLGKEGLKAGLSQIPRPLALKKLEDAITSMQRGLVTPNYVDNPQQSRPLTLLSVTISNDGLKLIYNQPLRNHSGQIVLSYNSADKKVNITIAYLGEARFRWKEIEKYLNLFALESRQFTMHIEDMKLSRDAIEFDLSLAGTKAPEILATIFNVCNNITYAGENLFKIEYEYLNAQMLSFYERVLEPQDLTLKLFENAASYLNDSYPFGSEFHFLVQGKYWLEKYLSHSEDISRLTKLFDEILNNATNVEDSRQKFSLLFVVEYFKEYMSIEQITKAIDILYKQPSGTELIASANKAINYALGKNQLLLEKFKELARKYPAQKTKIDEAIEKWLLANIREEEEKVILEELKGPLSRDTITNLLERALDNKFMEHYGHNNPMVKEFLAKAHDLIENADEESLVIGWRILSVLYISSYKSVVKIDELISKYENNRQRVWAKFKDQKLIKKLEHIIKAKENEQKIAAFLKKIKQMEINEEEFNRLITEALEKFSKDGDSSIWQAFVNKAIEDGTQSDDDDKIERGWNVIGRLYNEDIKEVWDKRIADDIILDDRGKLIAEKLRNYSWPPKEEEKQQLEAFKYQIKYIEDAGISALYRLRDNNLEVYNFIHKFVYPDS